MTKRKKRTEQIKGNKLPEFCPKCSGHNFIEVLYGLIDLSEDLMQKVARKKVIFGGCIIRPDSPSHICKQCKQTFNIKSANAITIIEKNETQEKL